MLVVEDDPFVRTHAVTSLESFGYKVLTATHGHEAIEKLGNNPSINVLFTDVVMPGGMSGWELAEQTQKLRPDIKILLTSGYPAETLSARGRHNADLPLLNKPYRKGDLGCRLREILGPAELANNQPPAANDRGPPSQPGSDAASST